MYKYITTDILEVGAGTVVYLTPKQAAARSLMLSCLDETEGKYLTLKNIVFKTGEEIAFESEPGTKAILTKIADESEEIADESEEIADESKPRRRTTRRK